jgi:hypothetical protein
MVQLDRRMGETWTLAFLRGTVRTIVLACGIVIASFPFLKGARNQFSTEQIVAAGALFAAMGGISYWLYLTLVKITQRRKDAWLKQHYLECVEGAQAGLPVFLYIDSVDAVRPWNIAQQLELTIAEVIGSFGAFISLAERERSYGAAKLAAPEESWGMTAAQLIKSSVAIFFVPSPAQSAQWEVIGILAEPGHLGKTAWVMPKASKMKSWWWWKQKEEAEWEQLAGWCLKKFGVELPAYDESGGVFRIEGNRQHGVVMDIAQFVRYLEVALKFSEIPQLTDDVLNRVWRRLAEQDEVLRKRAYERAFGPDY